MGTLLCAQPAFQRPDQVMLNDEVVPGTTNAAGDRVPRHENRFDRVVIPCVQVCHGDDEQDGLLFDDPEVIVAAEPQDGLPHFEVVDLARTRNYLPAGSSR